MHHENPPRRGRDGLGVDKTSVPRVSVIIPVHNRADELRQALTSLAAQTLDGWEAVVIDDRSTEDLTFVASDPRHRLLPLAEGQGAPAARNFGFGESRGEFVVFLDSDDLLEPTALAERVAFLEQRQGLDFAVWQTRTMRRGPGDEPHLWNTFDDRDDLDRYLRRDVVWQTTGPMWRRATLERIGPWDESAPAGQDWEFHARALALGLKYEKLDAVHVHWRLPSGDRASIGKSGFEPATAAAHARAWPTTIEHVYHAVDRAGALTEGRRQLFVGLFWEATRRLAERATHAEARATWQRVRELGLIGRRQFAEGWLYHRTSRLAWFNAAKQKYVRRWPREHLLPPSPTACRTPVDPERPPTVSVVIAAYNAVDYIEEAVASVLGQTFRDIEVVAVDDGSTDGTPAKLAELAAGDCRLKVIARRENRGLIESLNEGVAASRAALIARMDADDVCLPDRLTRQVAYLTEHSDVVLLGGQVQDIDPHGVPLHEDDVSTDHEAIDAELMQGRGGSVRHPAAVIRRESFDQVGGYSGDYPHAEDLALFLRLAEIGRVANLDGGPVLLYRQHPASINRTKVAEQHASIGEAVAAARARRNLPPDDAWHYAGPTPPSADEALTLWGWRALKQGHPAAAKKHALTLIRRNPFKPTGYRLLRSAWRGR